LYQLSKLKYTRTSKIIGDAKVIIKLFAKDLKKGVNTSFIIVINKGVRSNKVNKNVKKESKLGNTLDVLLKFLCINLLIGLLKNPLTNM